MSGLNILEVIITILVGFTGFVIACGQIMRGLRSRWIEDSRNTEATRANTSAVQDLTRAVAEQSSRIGDLYDRVILIESRLKG